MNRRGERVLIAGVGYRNLRDHSLGVMLTDRMADFTWPEGVEVSVEDLSFNPIAVVQRIEDDPPERRFTRAIFVAAPPRELRPPGSITAYRWDGVLPSDDGIQRSVVDAVTGVIHLDNTLVVARHFGALPDEVLVVEVEPVDHEFGDQLSAPVAAAFEHACVLVAALATGTTAADELPRTPLGGAGAWIAVSPN